MGYSVRRLVFVGENKWIKCDTVKRAFFSPLLAMGLSRVQYMDLNVDRIPIRSPLYLFYERYICILTKRFTSLQMINIIKFYNRSASTSIFYNRAKEGS